MWDVSLRCLCVCNVVTDIEEERVLDYGVRRGIVEEAREKLNIERLLNLYPSAVTEYRITVRSGSYSMYG